MKTCETESFSSREIAAGGSLAAAFSGYDLTVMCRYSDLRSAINDSAADLKLD